MEKNGEFKDILVNLQDNLLRIPSTSFLYLGTTTGYYSILEIYTVRQECYCALMDLNKDEKRTNKEFYFDSGFY